MTGDPAPPPEPVPEAELEELFARAPEGFVAARDALAARLRADGERDAAAWVKRLRRPTLAAWALNRAVREHDELRVELLDAVAGLAEAQARLLSGAGERDELRAAAGRQRAAEAALLRAVRALGDPNGRPLAEAVLERARETLAAVVLDGEARAELAAGRLTREHRAVGLGAFDVAAAPAQDPDRAARASGPRSAGGGRASGRGEAEHDRRREAERDRRRRELRATLADAERTKREAEIRREAVEVAAREAAELLAAARAAHGSAEEELARARTEERSASRAVADAERRLRRAEPEPQAARRSRQERRRSP